MRNAPILLAVFAIGLACVDLTPPPEVIDYRSGRTPGKGGAQAGATGPTDTGGAAGEVASGGGTGPGGQPGGGGVTATGGATQTPGSGGVTADAGYPPDVALGSGGAAGAGGGVGIEVSADTGGTTGAGGAQPDAPGGDTLDGSMGQGGVGSLDGAQGGGGRTGSGGRSSTGGATGAGGTVGSGGTTAGSGGATGSGGSTAIPATYDCASPIVPANGVVTNSADWNTTTSRWGSGGTLVGNTFQYSGGGANVTAKVGGNPVGLNVTGSVPANGGYGGGGLSFFSCVTAASFTRILFDVSGSASNCAIELQLQTYDQRPADLLPAGTCKADAGSNACFDFPRKSQVVTPPATNVSTTLSGLTNWSSARGAQLVGLQWQFTSTGSTCTPNVTFTNVRFQ